MNGPSARRIFWLKASVALIAAALLLLAAGALPRWGTPAIYHNGLMLAIGALIALLSLYASWKCRWKKPALFLLHAGGVLVIVGAFVDFGYERKVDFATYVGERFVFSDAYDERTRTSVPFGFDYAVLDFSVDYYPPTYSLFDMKTREKVEDGMVADDAVRFPKHGQVIALKDFSDRGGAMPHPVSFVDERLVAVQNRPVESRYRAGFRILDGGVSSDRVLEVNKPVHYKGWTFYLMSHGVMGEHTYVRLTARNAPGRIWVKSGIWMLIAGSFWLGFGGRRRKEAA